ncbi:MAG: tRNA-dihydrouridine synthase [Candidatus Lindowbacteria bacterium]|nr:tRNA-dihydrouridine synthase [Candidatus Lindowbacteria bacterium]
MNRYLEILKQNPIVGAPLADVTDLPFRKILRRYHNGLLHTEMVSVNALMNNNKKTWDMISNVEHEEKPLGIQLLASDDHLAEASARLISQLQPTVIDINMGCPVRKVLKANCGAALLDDPPRAAALVESVRAGTDIPVGVKIRLGRKNHTAREIIEALAGAGAEAVTLHGRTAHQLYRGPADRQLVLEIVKDASLPIIVSGDVMTEDDVRELLDGGAAGVLLARGMMGRPWFTAQAFAVAKDLPIPPTPDIKQVMLDHLDLVLEYYGDIGIRKFRRHLVEYVRGLPGAARLRREMMVCREPELLRDIIRGIGMTEKCVQTSEVS